MLFLQKCRRKTLDQANRVVSEMTGAESFES